MTHLYHSTGPLASYRSDPYGTEPIGHPPEWGTAYRSRGEVAVAQALEHLGIPFAYEPRLDLRPIDDRGNAYRGIDGVVYTRPDFYLLDGSGLVIEYAGMLDDASYLRRHRDKLDLYTANGVTCVEVLPEHLPHKRLAASVLEQLIAEALTPTPTPDQNLGTLLRHIAPNQ